jgi:hypothetical protein
MSTHLVATDPRRSRAVNHSRFRPKQAFNSAHAIVAGLCNRRLNSAAISASGRGESGGANRALARVPSTLTLGPDQTVKSDQRSADKN